MSFLVLVVDDEPDVEMLFRQQFRHDLRDNRFRDFAQSGASALQRIGDAAGESLILILSDINMPGMSGLDLFAESQGGAAGCSVIMITAYADDNTKRRALEGGADALLAKPIDFVLLRNEIEGRLAKAAQSASKKSHGPMSESGQKLPSRSRSPTSAFPQQQT
jgi:CheY-like chemotaxis protein